MHLLEVANDYTAATKGPQCTSTQCTGICGNGTSLPYMPPSKARPAATARGSAAQPTPPPATHLGAVDVLAAADDEVLRVLPMRPTHGVQTQLVVEEEERR